MAEPKVRYSTRTFAQEVAIANAEAGYQPPPTDWVYEFSHDRYFHERKPFYAQPVGTNTNP